MKILFHSRTRGGGVASRYQLACAELNERGHDATVLYGNTGQVQPSQFDKLLLWDEVPTSLNLSSVYGGRNQTRPELMTLLQDLQFPTMPWSKALHVEQLKALFAVWNTPRILLKRSGTMNGLGFNVLSVNQPNFCTWNPDDDLFCPEVNPEDGAFYKAEIFGGKIVVSWMRNKPALSDRIRGFLSHCGYQDLDPIPDETRAEGRELFEFPAAMVSKIEALSLELTARGYGYCCVDLMKKADGSFVAIELNTHTVATWWTKQFPFVAQRFAEAAVNVFQ